MATDISRYVVRTSGRRVFRRCLRKWGFQSSMKQNLQRKGTEQNINFWFGSAIHFAMEDYFGYNLFGDLQRAFQAYYAAFPAIDRPQGADEMYYTGMGMLDYFNQWYPKHNQDQGFVTVWLNPDGTEAEPGDVGARPLVEESFLLDLDIKAWVREDNGNIVKEEIHVDENGKMYFLEMATAELGDLIFQPVSRVYVIQVPIYYHGTIDRIVKDRQGRWWIMDWKTAKGADTNKLDTDDQISAYMWATEQWFARPIYGFAYVQLTKDVPKPPKRLQGGKMSVDKKQKTTYALARDMVIKDHGEVRKAPAATIEYLNNLALEETPEGDRYIRWDMVQRNQAQKVATYHHIRAEVSLMIQPNLYLFPNPTRDCIWDCNFREACLAMDNGNEEFAQRWLNIEFEPRPRSEDGNIEEWRKNVPWPDGQNHAVIGAALAQLELTASQTLNLILPDKYRDMEE